jgi:hypothetical protein
LSTGGRVRVNEEQELVVDDVEFTEMDEAKDDLIS